MHFIAYIVALPVIAILVLIALVLVFRHLLPLPELKPGAPSAGVPSTCLSYETAVADAAWERVTGRWNPWVTVLLPLLLGSAIMLTSIWLLAYVGWLALYVLHGPTVLLVQPPWFGSPRPFARFVMLGLISAPIGLFGVGIIGALAYVVGRRTLWPETVDCGFGAAVRRRGQ